jgi:stage II sporulation protein D
MRTALAALFVLALALGTASAGETVRVLIIDSEFSSPPADGETLTRLDTINGKFFAGVSSYIGKLEIWRGAKGLYVINELPIEDYVQGVVKAETARAWAFEALKAQAVVVRTYVARQKLLKPNRKYDITSSVMHQLYRGLNSDSLVSSAVKQTEGEVLSFSGVPIMAFYHSTSGAKTELPEEVFGKSYPYLKSVPTNCTLSPLCLWAMRIPLHEVEKAAGLKNITGVAVKSLTATGRVKEVEFSSNPSRVSLEAKELRQRLGWRRLPSTDFTVKIEDGNMVFEGSGFGHGVGLCQWSSQEMALEGKSYKEILSYFYPGTEIAGASKKKP